MMNSPTIGPSEKLIAPCGMNCGICIGYLRDKNPCSGCRSDSEFKPKHCVKCSIVNCEYLENGTSGFCYDCSIFPCTRLKRLDTRYRENYQMSMIDNLKSIQESGIETFLTRENSRWLCKNCQVVLSVHRNACLICGHPYKT